MDTQQASEMSEKLAAASHPFDGDFKSWQAGNSIIYSGQTYTSGFPWPPATITSADVPTCTKTAPVTFTLPPATFTAAHESITKHVNGWTDSEGGIVAG